MPKTMWEMLVTSSKGGVDSSSDGVLEEIR